MEKLAKQIGEKIRKARLKKGWSQEELAHETGLHRAYIGQIERGEKMIGIPNLKIISNSLQIKLSQIIDKI